MVFFSVVVGMGGSVSAGKNNDELIDHLVQADFIKTEMVQRIFRAVDRGNYYATNQKQDAYRDIAWRMGNLHLSAPCVYSVVLEALKLKAGLSFLNLGSGSGYLSTMAGLILGPYGINHGIEFYSDIVDFAYDKLEDFLKMSKAIDEYDFCEPSFMVGNCLTLDNTCQQYDRVYCGASCPQEYEYYIKSLIKVGGILIMPINDKLLKITRISENQWHTVKILSVSFAPLISPPTVKEAAPTFLKLGDQTPPKLQHLCRSEIRSRLRANIDKEHPSLQINQLKKVFQPRRPVRRIVIPFYNESDFTSQSNSEFEYDSDGPEYTISSRLPSRMSWFVEHFLRRHAELQLLREVHGDDSEEDIAHRPPPDNLPVRRRSTNRDSSSESGGEDSSDDMFSMITMNTKSLISSGSEEDFNRPPSHCTRNRKKRKKVQKQMRSVRARNQNQQEPGTSSGVSGTNSRARKKVKRSSTRVVWKKYSNSSKQADAKTNEEAEEENYSDFMAQKIGALPLPSAVIRYLNYKRENL